MLSNKWTFSLTSFVVLIAFGLVCLRTLCYGRYDAKANVYIFDVKIRQLKNDRCGSSYQAIAAHGRHQIEASGRTRVRIA